MLVCVPQPSVTDRSFQALWPTGLKGAVSLVTGGGSYVRLSRRALGERPPHRGLGVTFCTESQILSRTKNTFGSFLHTS